MLGDIFLKMRLFLQNWDFSKKIGHFEKKKSNFGENDKFWQKFSYIFWAVYINIAYYKSFFIVETQWYLYDSIMHVL